MFGLFKKKSRTEQLMKEYRTLLSEAHGLSTTNRRQSDSKYAEADKLLKEIEVLENS
jgi:hypothetical protein